VDLTPENKAYIDSLSYEGLLERWRFGYLLGQGDAREESDRRRSRGRLEAHRLGPLKEVIVMLGFGIGSKRREPTESDQVAQAIREARRAAEIAENHFNEATEPGFISEASAEVTKTDRGLNNAFAQARGQAPAEVEVSIMILPEDPLASSVIRNLARSICEALGVPEAIVKTRVIQ
jgi:hypothetical protein